ncbi:MAG TPA: sensor histidine kinase [Rhodopirellula baltica]|uniref:histidine kinase n=1 Tax=Rhodopirellula baltica (strain DSM 10527 / NCIMB 13988 / SH1) TaxID=243090 RepID=Q7UTM4_RHOBA|nr:HAMP domain-containing sensor histidine kinase [Rhodopirellula baltica]CAD73412.1 sensor histidine kinase [Rhodopirellula baltica SH 1]HBE63035.1 sensor histidine kinase [Rhodopirellula baltica]
MGNLNCKNQVSGSIPFQPAKDMVIVTPISHRPLTLRTPVTLGVVLIVLVVLLTAVWISGTVWGAVRNDSTSGMFWVMLGAGAPLLVAVLAGVIAYLTLSVKAFNLNRRQSNFIDSVTHELKSPIASLKLYLQTMTRHDVSVEQQKEFHLIMLEDVERLDSLINHLLDAARVERGGEAYEASDLSLETVLSKCAQGACVRYKMPPETVSIHCPAIYVHAPVVQIEILFRNLIDNAIKYGGSPPKVELTAVCSPTGDVTVSVLDNGTGIPANLRRKVFGRFVRLGSELERSKQGTGLGLYLVRNITHALGGRINIQDGHWTVATETGPTDSTKSAGADQPPSNPESIANRKPTGTRVDVTLPNGKIIQPETGADEPPSKE